MQSGAVKQRGAALALMAVGLLASAARAEEGTGAALRVGVISSLFRDTPSTLLEAVSRPLRVLVEAQTGLNSDMVLGGDAVGLAQKLKNRDVHLGVFHGFEFAWARQQFPELKPLVVVTAHHPVLHAHLVVRKDNPASTCGDLRGKKAALPAVSRGHLHLFLERRSPAPGSDCRKFYAEITRPVDSDNALDDVFEGLVEAAIVERIALEEYQREKPGRANKLRVLQQSETFPPSVIAYWPGGLSEAELRRLREGLLRAGQSDRGRELLKMCRITGFAEVPRDYEELLAAILKAYPAPLKGKDGK